MTFIPSVTVRYVDEPGRTLKWGVFWREPKRDGKVRKPSMYFATEAEANQFRDDFIAKAKATPDKPVESTSTPGTVGAWLDEWLIWVKDKREASTWRGYESVVRVQIKPAPVTGHGPIRVFGDLPLAAIKTKTVRTLYDDLFDSGVSLAHRKHVHSALSAAMTRAKIDELIDRNPCEDLGRELRHKSERAMDPEPNPFTRDQMIAFLAHVKAHEREWLEYFTFLFDTGVRVGEIAALKWATVDVDNKRARIEESYSPTDKRDKDPKTHQRRWLDLSDDICDLLPDLRQRQRKDQLARGRKQTPYVFTNRRGSPRRQDGNMRRVFDRVCTVLEFGDRDKAGNLVLTHTPHDIRDTFATVHLLDDYKRLPWVSRQLGHETERTTMKHYFKFLPSSFTKGYANSIRRRQIDGEANQGGR